VPQLRDHRMRWNSALMQNAHSTPKVKSFTWPAIAGHVITVVKSWHGGGHRGLLTGSPCGLIRNRGFGPSPFRRGFWTRKLATKFCLTGGIVSAVNCNGAAVTFAMLPSLRRIPTAHSSLTFISLHSPRHLAGSRTWLCTLALVIRRRSSK